MKQNIQNPAGRQFSQSLDRNVGPGLPGPGHGFSSGTGPIDPRRRARQGGYQAAQTRQAIANIKELLALAGGTLADVVKITVYVTDYDY